MGKIHLAWYTIHSNILTCNVKWTDGKMNCIESIQCCCTITQCMYMYLQDSYSLLNEFWGETIKCI